MGLTALGRLLADIPAGSRLVKNRPTCQASHLSVPVGSPVADRVVRSWPGLEKRRENLPESIRQGQRLTNMTAGQDSLPRRTLDVQICEAWRQWRQSANCCHTSAALRTTFALSSRSIHRTINHDPAVTFLTTGAQLAGRPSLGSWLSYGLGSENESPRVRRDALTRNRPSNDQPLRRLYRCGLPAVASSRVKLRSGGDPVLYLSNPAGIDASLRRDMLDDQAAIESAQLAIPRLKRASLSTACASHADLRPRVGRCLTRAEQAFGSCTAPIREGRARSLQTVCWPADLPNEVFASFNSFMGWDQHTNLPTQIPQQARDVDQPCAAADQGPQATRIARRYPDRVGMKFGRGLLPGKPHPIYGRDHNKQLMWMAGGGASRGGIHSRWE